MALVFPTFVERRRRMDCDDVREALSARIDGERCPVSSERVDAHLATCLPCQRWHADVAIQAKQLSKLAVAAHLRGPLGKGRVSGRNGWSEVVLRHALAYARWCLALLGIVTVVLTTLQVWEAASLRGGPVEGHLLGESAAWSLGTGVAMIVGAIQPATAAGLVGLLGTYSAALTVYVVAGVADGSVSAARELAHLPAPVGAVLAVLVWRGTRRSGPAPRGSASLEPASSELTHRHRWSGRGSAA